jgi:hypothetical protein
MAVHRQTTVLILLAVILTITVNVRTTMAIEKAQYKTVEREGKFELRQYEPYVAAETFVDADFSGAVDEGFSRLFKYIQGYFT